MTNLLNRTWKTLCSSSSSSFTIMQWNILADNLCTTDSFPYADPQCLKWEFRKEKLFSSLLSISPSIVVMEEVDTYDSVFKEFFKNNGYSSSFLLKNNGNDGTVIAWKNERFTAKNESFQFYYFESNSQGALCQILEDNITKKKLLVVGTHLKAKVGFEEFRLNQVNKLLENLKNNLTYDAIAILGDFNDEPSSLAVECLRNNSDIPVYSAYSLYGDGIDVEYTTCKKRHPTKIVKRTIDYIWLSREILQVHKLQEIPFLEKEEHLPTITYPSDHFSIAAEISWN